MVKWVGQRRSKLLFGGSLALLAIWLSRLLVPFIAHFPDKQEMMEVLLGHVGDHYQLHGGLVTVALPVLLYKVGTGWFIFSSGRFFDEHHRPVAYQGFQLQEGSITALDGAPVYDFSITHNVVWMLLSALVLLPLFIGLSHRVKRSKGTPVQGFWVLPLALVYFVRDRIARECIGPRRYQEFTPFLLTLFCYIFSSNLLGLLPGGANVTGNTSAVFALSLLVFCLVNGYANRAHWQHVVFPPGPLFMRPIMMLVEALGILMRPLVLGVRLLANMLAGHLMLLSVVSMVFILEHTAALVFVFFLGAALVILKIFVSFIQAFIFTFLAAMALGQSTAEHTPERADKSTTL